MKNNTSGRWRKKIDLSFFERPVDQALNNLWEPKILLFILVVLYNNVGFRRYIRLKI